MVRRMVNAVFDLSSASGWFRSMQTPSCTRGFSSTIFIGRLPFSTTDDSFRKSFSPFGTIKEARLIMDPATKRPKGFGFVEYETEAEARRALKAMNYKIIDGSLIFVEISKTNLQDK